MVKRGNRMVDDRSNRRGRKGLGERAGNGLGLERKVEVIKQGIKRGC